MKLPFDLSFSRKMAVNKIEKVTSKRKRWHLIIFSWDVQSWDFFCPILEDGELSDPWKPFYKCFEPGSADVKCYLFGEENGEKIMVRIKDVKTFHTKIEKY